MSEKEAIAPYYDEDKHMSEKIRVNITVDKAVWDMLGTKISCSKSQFVENCAREYLYGKDSNKDKLLKEIEELEQQICIRRAKLDNLEAEEKIERKEQEIKKETNTALNTALEAMFRFQNRFHHVGRDKIREIAQRCGVPEKDLTAACREEEMIIENFQDDKSHRY